MGSTTGLLTRGSLPRRLPGLRQWLRGGGASPLTAAGPSRIRTGFPHRAPACGRAYHRTVSGSRARLWLPVVAWAALIFAFSSVPDLGTGLGGWDLVLRKIAHAAEYALLGALLVRATGRAGLAVRARRALRGQRRDPPVVRPGPARLAARRRDRRRRRRRRHPALADGSRAAPRMTRAARARDRARCDRRHAPAVGAWLESARGVLDVDPDELPADRAEAAAALDEAGAGNWRVLLERFSEDHAPAYLRRDAATSARPAGARASKARRSASSPTRPEELARTALAPARRDTPHLGARDRRRRARAAARRRRRATPRSSVRAPTS